MAVFNRSNYWKNKQGENLSLLGAGQTKTFEVKCQRRQNSPLHESTSAHPSPKLMTTLCARSCKWTFSFCWQRDTSARTSKNARFQDARMNEKENSLTIIWEGEMGRGANGRRRGGEHLLHWCSLERWRDGGEENVAPDSRYLLTAWTCLLSTGDNQICWKPPPRCSSITHNHQHACFPH